MLKCEEIAFLALDSPWAREPDLIPMGLGSTTGTKLYIKRVNVLRAQKMISSELQRPAL